MPKTRTAGERNNSITQKKICSHMGTVVFGYRNSDPHFSALLSSALPRGAIPKHPRVRIGPQSPAKAFRMSQSFFVCCTGFDREFFGSAPSSLDRPLTHAVTFTDLLAAFVKNILSLSPVSFVLFPKPVLLQVRDALLQSLPLR